MQNKILHSITVQLACILHSITVQLACILHSITVQLACILHIITQQLACIYQPVSNEGAEPVQRGWMVWLCTHKLLYSIWYIFDTIVLGKYNLL